MDLPSITSTSLSLKSDQIGVEGARVLTFNSTLTTLDITGYPIDNYISNEEAKALSLNTTLTSLNLRYNKIGSEGAKALSLNTTLVSLDLCE